MNSLTLTSKSKDIYVSIELEFNFSIRFFTRVI